MDNLKLFAQLREFSVYTDTHRCADGAELFLIRKGTPERYEELLNFLKGLGFSEVRSHRIGEVLFHLLQKDTHLLTCSYTPFDGRMRVISEENGELPTVEDPIETPITTPLLTQIRTAYVACDCGMSYLLRLSDGRFVMIDGNAGEYEEDDHLFDVVTEQNVLGGKPVFAAWVITHPHGDHFRGFSRFVKKYGDQIELGDVIYNYPRKDSTPFGGMQEFDEFLDVNRGRIRVITARTGQVFRYGDAEFETLTAAEDYYPSDNISCNDTSLSFMLTFAGRRVLLLGDLCPKGAIYAANRFPPETFKCEFLQVGHHGYYGGCEEMYRAADPEILLWPCPDFWYPTVKQWKPNPILLQESSNVKSIFIGGLREDVFDMTQPTEYVSHYVDAADGETVYEENCAPGRVVDLGWNCVCGGKTGYKGAAFKFTDGGVELDATVNPENPTVCMFVQRGQMDLLSDFTLTLKGKVEPDSEVFGLFWNYPEHTVFKTNEVLPICRDSDGSFDFKLTADSAAGLATLYHNGALIATLPYVKKLDSGLYFVLKKARVTMRNVKLVKGVH